MNPYDVNRPSPIDEAAITAWTARQQAAIEHNRKRPRLEGLREARWDAEDKAAGK